MPKGSKTQNVTSTTVNPMQQLQMPFVEEAWKQAQNLWQNNNAANTIASQGDPYLAQGINQLYQTAYNDKLQPQANAFWQQGGEGSAYNSPAYQYFQNMASNSTPVQKQYQPLGEMGYNAGQGFSNAIAGYAPQIAQFAQQAGANNNLGMSTLGSVAQGQGLGMGQLGQTAQGDYINGNPYFAQMVQNAMDPITRNYQTALAPQLDASFASSGRYGSGAMLGQRENAQNVLADQLAKTSSNMYGQNYANERAQQLAAAQQYAGLQNQAGSNYGQLYNQGLGAGMQGLAGAANVQQGAGSTYQQGLSQWMNSLAPQLNAMTAGAQGLQGAYQAGNANALQAAQLYPSLASAQATPAEQQMRAATLYNAWQQQYLDQPYNALDRYLKQIGAVQGGSSSTTTPYFSNPMANAMSGISGGLGIMQQLGGLGGLGGGSAGAVPSGWIPGTGMGSGIYTNAATGVTSDVAGSGFPGIGQVASGLGSLGSIASGIGSIFTGGWIICTELMKQGRMPWRYWAVGSKAFAAYPEVVQRGYYLWAIPVVRHLRRKPDSMLSRITGAVFRWRAEDLAARRGIKGARKLLRGRAVTWALYPLCAAIGAVAPAQDWQQVYRDDAGSRTAG